jgi:transcriptional regulator with XRE-family HTH domain
MTPAPSLPLTLGRRIRRLRRDRAWSQEEFASRIGICESSLRAYEHGRTPGLPVLLRMSAAFHLTLDELLNGHTPDLWRHQLIRRLSACEPLPDELGELMVRLVDLVIALQRLPGPANPSAARSSKPRHRSDEVPS